VAIPVDVSSPDECQRFVARLLRRSPVSMRSSTTRGAPPRCRQRARRPNNSPLYSRRASSAHTGWLQSVARMMASGGSTVNVSSVLANDGRASTGRVFRQQGRHRWPHSRRAAAVDRPKEHSRERDRAGLVRDPDNGGLDPIPVCGVAPTATGHRTAGRAVGVGRSGHLPGIRREQLHRRQVLTVDGGFTAT
jgi:hypothetical protein